MTLTVPGSSPVDEEAEDSVIGPMVNNPVAAKRAIEVVTADDFYRPSHQRAFDAALAIADEQLLLTAEERVAADWDRDRRVDEVARRAGISPKLIAGLAESAPVMFDVEPWAHRVSNAAHRRSLMRTCGEAYNALGAGQPLADVVPVLAAVIHQVFNEYVRTTVMPKVRNPRRAA